jgi:DNA-binding MarR family transcriptional regulator
MNDVKEIIELSQKALNRIYFRERKPTDFGSGIKLHRAEVHVIQGIGKHPGINVTELASLLGITKGAVSQTLIKLAKKNLVIKNRHNDNDKEIALFLSSDGMMVYILHEDFHKKMEAKLSKALEGLNKKDINAIKRFFLFLEKHFETE